MDGRIENQTSDGAFPWDEILKRVLEEYHIPGNYKPVREAVESDPQIVRLKALWPSLSPEQKNQATVAVIPLIKETALQSRLYCVRCGQCCSNSSPTLHPDDLSLIRKGVIHPDHVVVLLPGQKGFSYSENRVVVLKEERIKIREKSPGEGCSFYEEGSRSCRIYEDRPVQCRKQACWAPEELLAILNGPFLTCEQIDRALGRIWIDPDKAS